MNRSDIHPSWCAANHACTAHAPAGEHRSTPVAWNTDAGRILATRIQTSTGHDRLEIRAIVDLPTDPAAAKTRSRQLVTAVYLGLRRTLATRPENGR